MSVVGYVIPTVHIILSLPCGIKSIGDSRLRRFGLTDWRVFSKLGVAKPILNQAENFPR
jgi:hypothetical protein